MLQHEAAYDMACREAAALPPEKRAAGRQRGATGSRRSSTMPARRSSMAPMEPTQAMMRLRDDGTSILLKLVLWQEPLSNGHWSSIMGA